MSRWGSSKKRKFIKAGFYSAFLAGLAGVCVFAMQVSNQEKEADEPEIAAVMAARKPAEVELKDVKPILLGEQEVDEPTESTMEIVNDKILSNVPVADYSYSFNENISGAKLVTREGDYGGFNEGTYPTENTEKTPLYTEGVEGEAIYLDGTYGLELCDMKPLSDSYTISFWMKAEELYNWSPFLMIGSNMLDVGVSQNYIAFNQKTTEEGEVVAPIFNTVNAVLQNSCEVRPVIEDKQCLNLNEWTYITICVDGSKQSEEDPNKFEAYLYVNSEMVGHSYVSKMCFDDTNMRAYLGISCTDQLFRACYDEVHIWNRMLEEGQINSMYLAYLQQT